MCLLNPKIGSNKKNKFAVNILILVIYKAQYKDSEVTVYGLKILWKYVWDFQLKGMFSYHIEIYK